MGIGSATIQNFEIGDNTVVGGQGVAADTGEFKVPAKNI